MNNILVKKPNTPTTFTGFMSSPTVQAKLNQVFSGKDPSRFTSSIISAVSTSPALNECDYSTILSAALLGESLKLSPSPQLGQYYLVPFKDTGNNRIVATFVPGYKGYIQLALRTGQYKKLNVIALKEGELVEYNPLDEVITVDLIKDPSAREEAKTTHYYAMFEYLNGFKKVLLWSKEKMVKHADRYSKAFSADGGTVKTKSGEKKKASYLEFEAGNYNKKDEWLYSSFWYKDFDSMAYKTMLRQIISKWGIMSVDFQTAYLADGGTVNTDGTIEHIENSFTFEPPAQITENQKDENSPLPLISGDTPATNAGVDPLNDFQKT